MPLLRTGEAAVVRAISRLAYANPFLPERIRWEQQALGASFRGSEPVWHAGSGSEPENPNAVLLRERSFALAQALRDRLAGGAAATREELVQYRDVVLFALYHRYAEPLFEQVVQAPRSPGAAAEGTGPRPEAVFYPRFAEELERFLAPLSGLDPPLPLWAPEHLFAAFFQIRRAFHLVFRHVLGSSMPAARLRAQVWQSVFTHDLELYLSSLYRTLGEWTTLVTGPSGTGKEVVARAIGLSRYIPFQPREGRFAADFEGTFFALNLSALSPTLIESELFGHRRGSFTGAVADRTGWLETCPAVGTVFLDEIAEIDGAIQVKLLRVLETRVFQRLGETRPRRFEGKVVAATNRDLAREVEEDRFRADLYYRLCSDVITAPSLAERLQDRPEERRELVQSLVERLVEPEEAISLSAQVDRWIGEHLGPDYPWPGNVRELGQCVRNVLVRGSYQPPRRRPVALEQRLAEDFRTGRWTADELLDTYCTLVYGATGSYMETGRRLGLDRRTIKSRLRQDLLAELRGS